MLLLIALLACTSTTDDTGDILHGGADAGTTDGGGDGGEGDGGATDGGGGDGGSDRPEFVPTAGWVQVPAGSFVMGSPEGELGRADHLETQRTVTISHPFELSPTELTRGQFQALLGYDPSGFAACDECPADSLTWFDAVAAAEAMSRQAALPPCTTMTDVLCDDGSPSDDVGLCGDHGGIAQASVTLAEDASPYACLGYRLPTEAEWEYAARAGTTAATYNGDVVEHDCSPLDAVLDPIAWYCGNTGSSAPRAVGGKLANDWGLYDTLGNIYEWTLDGFTGTVPDTAVTDPWTEEGSGRVLKGGSWITIAAYIRAAAVCAYPASQRDSSQGVRLARSAW